MSEPSREEAADFQNKPPFSENKNNERDTAGVKSKELGDVRGSERGREVHVAEEQMAAEKENGETRDRLSGFVESGSASRHTHLSPIDPHERLVSFEAFKKQFQQKSHELLGSPTPESWWSRFTTKNPLGKGLLNITRMLPDMIQRIQSLGKATALKEARVVATVVNREEFINDPAYRELFTVPENKQVLENFLTRELGAEVNATRFLLLEGITAAQLHAWVRQLGYSPFAFLSDDRGENAGRASIDNDWPADDRHPLLETPLSESEMRTEKALWQPVFPKLRWLPGIGKWRESRTHFVLSKVKTPDGKEVLLVPVHMDARNAVVAFRDLLDKVIGKKREGRAALDYHRIHTGQKNYVGTGLYDLGIKNLLRLFEEHQQLIGSLRINGREKVQTTGTIVGDDKITWQINDLVKSGTY